MKFSFKVFLCTMLLTALSLGAGGYILISSMFRASLDREIQSAQEQNQMLRFTFETATNAINTGSQTIDDRTIREIARAADTGTPGQAAAVRVSSTPDLVIYDGGSTAGDSALLSSIESGTRGYSILSGNGKYTIHSACRLSAGNRNLYLESFRDITGIFTEREQHYSLLRWNMVLILAACGVITLLLTHLLTRPIRALSSTAQTIAAGNYGMRAVVTGDDEIGELAENFNIMTDRLEAKLYELADAAQRQEDFTASFAHELKTPLTAIIGYADLLRSRKLDPDKQFHSASYIYSEGRRLEALSHKLMDLFVLRHGEIEKKPVDGAALCHEVLETAQPSVKEAGLTLLVTNCDKGSFSADAGLIKTLLLNLIDNARKASPAGSTIELSACVQPEGYRYLVRDHGCGIAPEELERITEAFYMVDKSRARASGGAGLGLTICSEIAACHHTSLIFESVPGEGTSVSILFPDGGEQA